MAAAIGQSCHIPIIVRTLACHMHRFMDDTALNLDRNFILTLDAGCDSTDLSAVAESYYLPWWTSSKPPTREELLNYETLNDAIAYHRRVSGIKGILPLKVNKEKYTWSRHLSFDPQGLSLDCNQCRLYRGVSLGILDNIQDLRHKVSFLEVTFNDRANRTERRAAGFFQLYEAALAKEFETLKGNSNTKGKGKSRKIPTPADVRDQAAEELARLKSLPSLKWTWGPDLTVDNVLHLFRISSPSRVHSGYEVSLPWGRVKESSENLSISSSSPLVSDLAADIIDVPDLDSEDVPHHFKFSTLSQSDTSLPTTNLPVISWLHPPPADFIPHPPKFNLSMHPRSASLSDESSVDVPAMATAAVIGKQSFIIIN